MVDQSQSLTTHSWVSQNRLYLFKFKRTLIQTTYCNFLKFIIAFEQRMRKNIEFYIPWEMKKSFLSYTGCIKKGEPFQIQISHKLLHVLEYLTARINDTRSSILTWDKITQRNMFKLGFNILQNCRTN